jgi:gluconolactonase
VTLPDVLPDGLAFDVAGNLYVACYEQSQVLRVTPDGAVETVAADPEAHALCHPTNLAFGGETRFAANLGRSHVTEIEIGIGIEGLLLR